MSDPSICLVDSKAETPRKPGSSRAFSLREGLSSIPEKLWKWENRAPLLFTVSSVSVSMAQMIAGIAIVQCIVPRELGIWQSVNLALTYSFFVLAGIQNGLSRELPFYLGAQDAGTANQLAETSLSYTGIGCLLSLLGGVGALVFLVSRHRDPKVILAVGAVTLLVMFNFYKNYLVVTFRCSSSFLGLARVQMWEASLMIASLPLIYLLRYQGMLLRVVLVTGIAVYLLHRVRPLKVSPGWKTQSFQMLLKTGIPIFALDYMKSTASTFDRLILLRYAGVDAVGYYGLALSAYGAFEVLPISIAHYIYPRMTYAYGKEHNARGLWDIAWKASLVNVVVMVPLAAVGWFALPPLVKTLFPKYVTGTHAAQLMLLCGICAGAVVGANALWSLKAWKWMFAYQASLAAFLAIGPFVGIRLSSSMLTGVAYGMLGARLLATAIGMGLTYFATHR